MTIIIGFVLVSKAGDDGFLTQKSDKQIPFCLWFISQISDDDVVGSSDTCVRVRG